jgi:vacuolar-type H+-ATPase subunit I/STV1
MTDKKTRITEDKDLLFPPPGGIVDGSMTGAGIYCDIKDLEQGRDNDRQTIKRLLIQIDGLNMVKKDLERQLTEVVTKYNATKEDFDRLVIKTEELEEALKKTSFPKASELPTAASLWIPAKDIIILFAHLKKARDDAARNWALEKSRVLIEWEANTGRVTGARLEEK